MGLRELLIILGGVVIVLIIVDGIRRMRTPVSEESSDHEEPDPEEKAKQEQIRQELPNGGARVVKTHNPDTFANDPVPVLCNEVSIEPEEFLKARAESLSAAQKADDAIMPEATENVHKESLTETDNPVPFASDQTVAHNPSKPDVSLADDAPEGESVAESPRNRILMPEDIPADVDRTDSAYFDHFCQPEQPQAPVSESSQAASQPSHQHEQTDASAVTHSPSARSSGHYSDSVHSPAEHERWTEQAGPHESAALYVSDTLYASDTQGASAQDVDTPATEHPTANGVAAIEHGVVMDSGAVTDPSMESSGYPQQSSSADSHIPSDVVPESHRNEAYDETIIPGMAPAGDFQTLQPSAYKTSGIRLSQHEDLPAPEQASSEDAEEALQQEMARIFTQDEPEEKEEDVLQATIRRVRGKHTGPRPSELEHQHQSVQDKPDPATSGPASEIVPDREPETQPEPAVSAPVASQPASVNAQTEKSETNHASWLQGRVREKPVSHKPVMSELEEREQFANAAELMIIHVKSKDSQGFPGATLLHIALACAMQVGQMQVFHRFRKTEDGPQIEFSMVSSVNPGTFDIDSIDELYVPGVSMIMALPAPGSSQECFTLMLETAKVIAKNLNGELRDENRGVMTPQTIEHYRQRIQEFERRRQLNEKAANR